MKSDAIVFLDSFLAGEPEGIEWMREGWRRWLKSRGAVRIENALRLPSTSAKLAQTYRDAYLLLAADALTQSADPWRRAAELGKAVRHFLRYRWLAWRQMDAPPSHATEIERLLFLGQKYKPIPRSDGQLFNILSK